MVRTLFFFNIPPCVTTVKKKQSVTATTSKRKNDKMNMFWKQETRCIFIVFVWTRENRSIATTGVLLLHSGGTLLHIL